MVSWSVVVGFVCISVSIFVAGSSVESIGDVVGGSVLDGSVCVLVVGGSVVGVAVVGGSVVGGSVVGGSVVGGPVLGESVVDGSQDSRELFSSSRKSLDAETPDDSHTMLT